MRFRSHTRNDRRVAGFGGDGASRTSFRATSACSGDTRELVRLVYRDPEHVTERLALYTAEHLAEPSREWADAKVKANPDTSRVEIADELRTHSARVARIDGAVAGTPFFIALVPGPSDPRTTAEMLALRGVQPTSSRARDARPSARRPAQASPWLRSATLRAASSLARRAVIACGSEATRSRSAASRSSRRARDADGRPRRTSPRSTR